MSIAAGGTTRVRSALKGSLVESCAANQSKTVCAGLGRISSETTLVSSKMMASLMRFTAVCGSARAREGPTPRRRWRQSARE